MTAYDWLMACGAVVIIAFVARAFWLGYKVDAIKQPDGTYPGSAPTDGHTSGGD